MLKILLKNLLRFSKLLFIIFRFVKGLSKLIKVMEIHWLIGGWMYRHMNNWLVNERCLDFSEMDDEINANLRQSTNFNSLGA